MRSLKILEIDNSCTGCAACANICPTTSIDMRYDVDGFYYPFVNFETCIDCKKCEQVCHVLIKDNEEITPAFSSYMCWSNDDIIRLNSSSGGMFSMLSNSILQKKGVVFGTHYNFEKEQLEHNQTDNFPLSEFRKSKYIESNTRRTFSEVSTFLKQGRWVLFCGTPCQVIGLKSFLQTIDKSKLLLVDFICHGVPSNKHFTEYEKYICKRNGINNLMGFDFRPKTKGWTYVNIKFLFDNHKCCDMHYAECYYFRAFMDNILLRKCCYSCTISNRHQSDITLADFWGVFKYKPEINDNKGISLVIVNSDQGEKCLDDVKDVCQIEEVPQNAVEYAYKKNDAEYSLERRNQIAKMVKKNGYIATMKTLYGKQIFLLKIKKMVKKLIQYCNLR